MGWIYAHIGMTLESGVTAPPGIMVTVAERVPPWEPMKLFLSFLRGLPEWKKLTGDWRVESCPLVPSTCTVDYILWCHQENLCSWVYSVSSQRLSVASIQLILRLWIWRLDGTVMYVYTCRQDSYDLLPPPPPPPPLLTQTLYSCFWKAS